MFGLWYIPTQPQRTLSVMYLYRRSVTADIECMYDEIQLKLKQQLRETTCVSVTVDIWSDRKMRSFLGVTAHYLSNDTLHSKLMACETLTGWFSTHTASPSVGTFSNSFVHHISILSIRPKRFVHYFLYQFIVQIIDLRVER